jgi:hypothetical protein
MVGMTYNNAACNIQARFFYLVTKIFHSQHQGAIVDLLM